MPAVVTQTDIWNMGTSQTNGFQSAVDDDALRVALVEGLANTASDTQDAIDAVIDEVGVYHHINTSLPLAKARVQKWSPTQAYVWLRYSRKIIPGSQQVNVTIQIGSNVLPWYRKPYLEADPSTPIFTNGRPSGDLRGIVNKKDPIVHPKAGSWRSQLLDVSVHTVLAFDPTSSIVGFADKLNRDGLQWGSRTFAVAEVLFCGATVNWLELANRTIIYPTIYHFAARAGGWYGQDTYWDAATGEWKTADGLMYESAAMSGQFPVGT